MTSTDTSAHAVAVALRRHLGATNPVTGDGVALAPPSEAQLLLQSIVSGERDRVLTAAPVRRSGTTGASPARGPARRWVLAAAAVAGLSTAGVLARWPGSQTAVAESLPVLPYALPEGAPAAGALERIAAAADLLPAPARAEYGYVRTTGWYQGTSVSGGAVSTVLASTQVELWADDDGRGRQRQVPGPVLVQRVGSRETLDSLLGPAVGGSEASETTLGEGGASPSVRTDLDRLAWEDPRAWANAVHQHDNPDIPVAVDVVTAIGRLFSSQPVDPGDRARTWRLLAALPDVQDRGPLADRLGRTGRAFTVDSSHFGGLQQHLLVVDETTGQMLESDDVALADPTGAEEGGPVLLSLTLLVAAAWVASADVRAGVLVPGLVDGTDAP